MASLTQSAQQQAGGAAQAPGQAAAGKEAPPAQAKVGWSAPVAAPGGKVFVTAKLAGYMPETEVVFKIFSASGDPGAPLATLKALSDASGHACAGSTVKFDPTRGDDPRLLFEADVEGITSISPALIIVDKLEVEATGEKGRSLAGLTATIVDENGATSDVTIPPDGHILGVIAMGEFSIAIKDHLIEGENKAGEKKFGTGKTHSITFKKMTHTIQFLSPKDGDVLIAGQRIPIRTKVFRDGEEVKIEPGLIANGEGTVDGGGGAGQNAQRGTGETALVLADQDGQVTLQASYLDGKAEVTVKVIKPTIRRIDVLDNDGNVFPLFNHKTGKAEGGHFVFDPKGALCGDHSHPAAVSLGTKVKARVFLFHEATPSGPFSAEVALATGPINDEGIPAPVTEGMKGKPLVLRLPADKQAEGVKLTGNWDEEPIELISDRELPAAVRVNALPLDAHLRVKGELGWSGGDATPNAWARVSQLTGFEVFTIWGKPDIASGTPKKPDATPLKKNEFDPFHVRHAATWAKDGFNLNADGEGSILKKVATTIGHYRFPEGYAGKDGKPANQHERPDNLQVLKPDQLSDGEMPKEAPSCDDKIELDVEKRGGKTPRNASTDQHVQVQTGGGLEVEVEVDKDHVGSLKFIFSVDGKEVAQSDPVPPGEKTERMQLGPVGVGPHTVTISPEIQDGYKVLATWKGKVTIHFTKITAGEARSLDDNWGFGVLDNKITPGGKLHQQASAIAAALGAIGVKAGVNLLRAREGGAINFISHDPITLGASCFDPEKHWGPNVTAFAAVPVDKSRDNEPVFKNVKPLHSDKVLAIDPRSRKVTTIEEVQKTGHFRRKPIRNKLINENCRCGEPFNPESAPDWKARIGSGIPFEIVFSDGVNGANPKPEVVPGVAYTVEKAGDKILLTGPIPEPNLSASMEGAFWSFSVWPHRRGKRNHKGRKARHFLPVDQKTGIITAALSGGRGTYKIRYHQGEEQIGPVIATSKKSLRGLKLTKDARKLGWKLAGPKLTPPPDVLQKLLTETSESEISQDDFDKNLISIKGVKLLFSADGRLSTPDGAIAVGELKAGKVPVFQGGATTKITHHPFPLTSRFKRRFFHRFAQVL
ncbi:MAG: hypothetical protein ACYS22_17535, partial [Planctomycetota bacterium]